MIWRHLPPVVNPVKIEDCLIGLLYAIFRRHKTGLLFRQEVSRFLGLKNFIAVDSCRTALAIALHSLKSESKKRDEVLVPCFTCPAVIYSIRSVDLNPVFCDINPETLTFNLEKVESLIKKHPNLLAILLPYHFGLPPNLKPFLELSTKFNLYLIEDAAQAFGSTYKNKPVGTWGYFGAYSLGKGKSFTSWSGGILCGPSERLPKIKANSKPQIADIGRFILLLTYSIILHPNVWRVIDPIFPKVEKYKLNFDINSLRPLSSFQCAIAFKELHRFYTTMQERNQRAAKYRKLFKNVPIYCYPEHSDIKPSYLRFPILLPDKSSAERAIHSLRQLGLGVGFRICQNFHLGKAFKEEFKIGNTPGTDSLVERLVTLPVHHYVADSDQEMILKQIEKSL